MSIETETTFEYKGATVTITKDTNTGLLGYSFVTWRGTTEGSPIFRYLDSVKRVAKASVVATLKRNQTIAATREA